MLEEVQLLLQDLRGAWNSIGTKTGQYWSNGEV